MKFKFIPVAVTWWVIEGAWVGLGTEFRSEKIPRNRLGMISVILRKKVLIPWHSDFRGRPVPKLGTERNPAEKISLQNS